MEGKTVGGDWGEIRDGLEVARKSVKELEKEVKRMRVMSCPTVETPLIEQNASLPSTFRSIQSELVAERRIFDTFTAENCSLLRKIQRLSEVHTNFRKMQQKYEDLAVAYDISQREVKKQQEELEEMQAKLQKKRSNRLIATFGRFSKFPDN